MSTPTRKQVVSFLKKKPVEFAKMVGFTRLTDLHNSWIKNMVFGKHDETLMAHRSSYKTTCVSVSLAIIMILFPNKRIMFIRKTDSDVKEVLRQVSNILTNQYTRYIVKLIYENVSLTLKTRSSMELSTNLTTDLKGTSQLVGIGTGSSLTGKHFDIIFTDDIINVNDRISKAERDRTKIIYQELQNIKNNGGRIFNTLTPWHKDDASTLMPEPIRYDCYSTGILSPEEIQEKREAMTAALFAANYELRHIASDDVIFVSPRVGGDPAMVEQGIVHIDAAYGGEDYTAFTIVRKVGGVYYVYGRLWRKHVDDVEDEIIFLRKTYNCGRIYCEDNGDKGYLAKQLRRKGERVVTYHESMNKYLKITSYLKGEWTNVVFVNGTDAEYIQQICDYNENAEHDDAPDSLASAIRTLWAKKTEQTQQYISVLR